MAGTQNTLIVIDDTTISTNIKPALIAELLEASKTTRWSLSRLLDEAIDNYCNDVVPVRMESAERRRKQKV